MFGFRRKSKNRRTGREHVLDVKLRSRQVRATRLRLTILALALASGTLLGFFLVWRAGEWALDRLLYKNQAFAIQEIDVQTDGVIAPAELRRWAGVKPGQNLLALDLSRVKRDLELFSSVRSVAVERVLPGTIRLRVSEREPLAQVYVPQPRTNGGLNLVVMQLDLEGFVISPLTPSQRAGRPDLTNAALPFVVGAPPNTFIPGRQVESPQIRAALNLIDAFESSAMASVVDLVRVDVSSPDIVVATTSAGGVVTFAAQDVDRQLRRWQDIYDFSRQMNKAIATLDLSVTNSIPLRVVDAASAPPAPRPVRNQPRTRNRNV